MHLYTRPADQVLVIRASSVLRVTSHFACRPAPRKPLTTPKSPAIFRPVQKSRTKRIVVHVAADRVSTDTIEISLDYYRVLKARRVNSTELLKRSYENLLRQVPDRGYSKDTLNSRKVLLNRAAETMLDSDKRRAYDQILASNEVPTITVEPRYFAGAMALLQEAGETAQVVELGTRWLNNNVGSSSCRDIALAVAKAYCDLASITLSSGEGIAFCCEELEAALDLLRACDVGHNLQMDISGALQELAPQYILEQLALPEDPEYAARRERGMALLKQMIWDVDEEGNLSPGLEDRQGFLSRAREQLTAQQQIELFESCPKGMAMPMDEMYDSAMAYIAEGYRSKWPQLIVKAEKVLQRVQVGSYTGVEGGTDVSVEIGLCSLLLGETDRAMLALGLNANSNKVPDRDVLAFVKQNSLSEDDLLPGLCALAEVWLKETILPNYKEINLMTSSLGEWFQSPRVSVYLRGKDLNLVSAVKLSSSVAKGISAVVSKTLDAVRNLFRRPKFFVENGGQSVGRLKLPRVDIERLSQSPTAREGDSGDYMAAAKTLNSIKNTPIDDQDKLKVEEDLSPEGDQLTIGDMLREDSTDWWTEEGNVMEEPTKSRAKGHWMPILLGSAVFLAIAVAGLVPRSTLIAASSSIQQSATRLADSVKDVFDKEASGTIDVPLAEQLLRRWHVAKSEALGKEHDIEKLADVLEGNMLKQWKRRAYTVRTDGWHWEYTLVDLSVDKVSVEKDGKRATVEASIKEKAELIDEGKRADWYSTSYSVQYDLSMKRQGWKISGARVVYNS